MGWVGGGGEEGGWVGLGKEVYLHEFQVFGPQKYRIEYHLEFKHNFHGYPSTIFVTFRASMSATHKTLAVTTQLLIEIQF